MSFDPGALRLKPSVRVRLHGRDRLPELAVAMTLGTTALLFGACYVPSASGDEGLFLVNTDSARLVEMRSVATSEASISLRKDVRVIRLDHASVSGGGND